MVQFFISFIPKHLHSSKKFMRFLSGSLSLLFLHRRNSYFLIKNLLKTLKKVVGGIVFHVDERAHCSSCCIQAK